MDEIALAVLVFDGRRKTSLSDHPPKDESRGLTRFN
jgi:hypothetical protein